MSVGVSARHLHRLIEADGRFTVGLRSGLAVRSGISVCARPSRSLAFPLERVE